MISARKWNERSVIFPKIDVLFEMLTKWAYMVVCSITSLNNNVACPLVPLSSTLCKYILLSVHADQNLESEFSGRKCLVFVCIYVNKCILVFEFVP